MVYTVMLFRGSNSDYCCEFSTMSELTLVSLNDHTFTCDFSSSRERPCLLYSIYLGRFPRLQWSKLVECF